MGVSTGTLSEMRLSWHLINTLGSSQYKQLTPQHNSININTCLPVLCNTLGSSHYKQLTPQQPPPEANIMLWVYLQVLPRNELSWHLINTLGSLRG